MSYKYHNSSKYDYHSMKTLVVTAYKKYKSHCFQNLLINIHISTIVYWKDVNNL